MAASATAFGKNFMPRVAALLDVAQVSEIIAVQSADTFVRPIYAGNCRSPPCSRPTRSRWSRCARRDSTRRPRPASCAPFETARPPRPTRSSRSSFPRSSPSPRGPSSPARGASSRAGAGSRAERTSRCSTRSPTSWARPSAPRAPRWIRATAPTTTRWGRPARSSPPRLYIAVGISGAIQHLAGMKDSKVIVAINKDPEAPIFQVADYGLVGDLFQVVPELHASPGRTAILSEGEEETAMSEYVAPLKDMRFVLKHVVGLDQVNKLPGWEEVTDDVVDAVLEEAARFANEVISPLNVVGDRARAPKWKDAAWSPRQPVSRRRTRSTRPPAGATSSRPRRTAARSCRTCSPRRSAGRCGARRQPRVQALPDAHPRAPIEAISYVGPDGAAQAPLPAQHGLREVDPAPHEPEPSPAGRKRPLAGAHQGHSRRPDGTYRLKGQEDLHHVRRSIDYTDNIVHRHGRSQRRSTARPRA